MNTQQFLKLNSRELSAYLREKSISVWNDSVRAARAADPNWTIDLSKTNLSNLSIGRVDLKGANLSDACLESASLGEANLQGANLSKADLRNTIFKAANMSDANLEKADIRGANFVKADLVGANLRVSKAKFARFDFADLENTSFGEVALPEVSFMETKFRNTDFSEVDFEGAVFKIPENTSHRKATLTGGYHRIDDFVESDQVHLFSIEEDPGYLIEFGCGVGDIEEFTDHLEGELSDGTSEFSQAQVFSVIPKICDVVSSWPEAHIDHSYELPIPQEPDRRSDYLLAEARRTGRSPADIVLGDD